VNYILHLISLHSKYLQYLNISHNQVTQNNTLLVDYIKNYLIDKGNSLSGLNISNNNIGDKNMIEIMIGVSKNRTLKKLWFAETSITDFCGIIIGTSLKYDKKLELLDLSGNNIGNETFISVFKGIISNTKLSSLFLCNCKMEDKHLRVIKLLILFKLVSCYYVTS